MASIIVNTRHGILAAIADLDGYGEGEFIFTNDHENRYVVGHVMAFENKLEALKFLRNEISGNFVDDGSGFNIVDVKVERQRSDDLLSFGELVSAGVPQSMTGFMINHMPMPSIAIH